MHTYKPGTPEAGTRKAQLKKSGGYAQIPGLRNALIVSLCLQTKKGGNKGMEWREGREKKGREGLAKEQRKGVWTLKQDKSIKQFL